MKNSIRKKSDFSFLRRFGVRKKTGMLTLILSSTNRVSPPLMCVVAGKRTVGNSVARNRAKRRVRSLVREYSDFLSNGDLLMVITKRSVCSAPYTILKQEYLYALKKVKELSEKNDRN